MKTEKLKPGRKPLPDDQKRKLVSAYLTNAEKELIISKFGSLTNAVKHLLSTINEEKWTSL